MNMIVEIWQFNNDPEHLVMCMQIWDHFQDKNITEVINGFYELTDKMKEEFQAKLLGLIDWPYINEYRNEYRNEDYDITLERFKNGERAEYIVCPCCDVGSWRNEKGKKIEEPNSEEFPWNDGNEE